MNGTAVPLACLLGAALACFSATLCYALRNFSFRRLEEVCAARGRPERFGTILKRCDAALVAAEALAVLSAAATAVLFAAWTWWPAPAASEPPDPFGLRTLIEVPLVLAGWVALMVVVPWSVSRVAGEALLCRTWPLLAFLLQAARPLVAAAEWVDRILHRLAGRELPDGDDGSVLTEEIRTVVDEGQREGLLESEARTMIHRVMDLADEDAAAIMTPRTDMDVIPASATLEEARRRLLEAGHSRVPVVGETTDDIVGILYAKDLLRHVERGDRRDVPLAEIVREPLYVPETTGLATLLETMKRKRIHFAIVIDEYGGVSGLVTMEDILEEIVGDIVDEYDEAEADEIRTVAPGIIEVEARTRIDELNERFEYDLPEDGDFDTIGGFVFARLGRVPAPGENFTWKQLRFTVLDANERRIDKLRIEVDAALAAAVSEEG